MQRRPKRGRWLWTLAGAALLIALLAAVWRYTPLSEYLTQEQIAAWAKYVRGSPWAPAVLVAAYVPATFLMFPRQLLTLFAAFAFGPWLGFAYSMAGVLLASIAAYFVGRVVSPARLDSMLGDTLKRVRKRVKQHGVIAVLSLRVLPTLPFVVESMAAGALRIKLWEYAVGTMAGMAPGVLMLTVFGAQMSAVLDDASTLNYWLVGGALVVFAVVTFLLRRWLSR